MNKVSYMLATFNEPLTEEGANNLPAHVIEEPAEDAVNPRDLYANVHQMVRANNLAGIEGKFVGQRNDDYRARANQIKEQKPVLVFEELTNDAEPAKYYGFRDKFMSQNEQSKIPNYALMIYDVSKKLVNLSETEAGVQTRAHRAARQIRKV